MKKPNHYETLGVAEDATLAQIKHAYRRLAAKYHPDRANGDAELMKAINAAYAVLSDEKKRAEYDLSRIGTQSKAKNGARKETKKKAKSSRGDPSEGTRPMRHKNFDVDGQCKTCWGRGILKVAVKFGTQEINCPACFGLGNLYREAA